MQSPWQLAAGTQLSPAPLDSIPRAQRLTCDQRAHDDMGRFGLHHRGLLCTVSGRQRGRGAWGDAGLSLLHLGEVLILALWNHWLPGDAAHVLWRRSHGCRVLKGIIIAECPAVHPDGQGHLA